MESKGTVIAVLEPKTGTSQAGKEWKDQTFVIETDGQWPKKQAFSVFGTDRTIPEIGDVVSVSFEYESREWNGNWYSNGKCFKLEIENPKTTVEQPPQNAPAATAAPAAPATGKDDLPF